jgi:hypothetical protein
MNRRAFLSALSGGLLAAPLAADAREAAKVARIGYLAADARTAHYQAFTRTLDDWAPGPPRLVGS